MSKGKLSPSVAHARGVVAGLSRSRSEEDPEYIAAKQRLKELKFEEYITRTVNAFPQLRQEQIDRITGLLKPLSGNRPAGR